MQVQGMIRAHRGALWAGVLAVTAVVALPGVAGRAVRAGAGDAWETRAPEQVGMSAAGVQAAVEYALEHETSQARDREFQHSRSFGREPLGEGIGPSTCAAGRPG